MLKAYCRTIRTTPRLLGTFSVDKVPDFAAYEKPAPTNDRTFTYCMLGSSTVLAAATAKNVAFDYLANFAPSNAILAMAKIEVDLSDIALGKNLVVKWRGKPVFIRHRTPDEIATAQADDSAVLIHPERDAERFKVPEWLVVIGICTHLGCVPVGESGEYGGWFCPCHGSHYDISGRIRKGPAPLNLEVPPLEFAGNSVVIG